MPSLPHEFLIDLLRQHPQLLLRLLHDSLGLAPPPHSVVRVCESDVTDLIPVEARADLVLLFLDEGRLVYALIVEIQLDRDGDKWFTWPLYWAAERARRRCPVGVLVVTLSEEVAQWAGRLLSDGNPGGGALRPLVLGPGAVPPVTDEAQAAQAPELAMLSLLAHAEEPVVADVARAALSALKLRPEEQATLYYQVILMMLERACRKGLLERPVMEAIKQKYEDLLKSELYELGCSLGEARGEARSVLKILRKRGVAVDAATETRILACQDPVTLDRWLDRSLTITSLPELFAE